MKCPLSGLGMQSEFTTDNLAAPSGEGCTARVHEEGPSASGQEDQLQYDQ